MPYKNKILKNAQQRRVRRKYRGQFCAKHGGNINTPKGTHCRVCNAGYQRRCRFYDPRIVMLVNAKTRAKQQGLPFSITKADIPMPAVCPVLGVKFHWGKGKQSGRSPSLDRINNHKGYVKGNVAIISLQANRIKNNATIRELEQVLKYMRKRLI